MPQEIIKDEDKRKRLIMEKGIYLFRKEIKKGPANLEQRLLFKPGVFADPELRISFRINSTYGTEKFDAYLVFKHAHKGCRLYSLALIVNDELHQEKRMQAECNNRMFFDSLLRDGDLGKQKSSAFRFMEKIRNDRNSKLRFTENIEEFSGYMGMLLVWGALNFDVEKTLAEMEGGGGSVLLLIENMSAHRILQIQRAIERKYFEICTLIAKTNADPAPEHIDKRFGMLKAI